MDSFCITRPDAGFRLAMLDFPLIPFVPTALYITSVGETDVTATFGYDGKNFSGTKKFRSLALDFQARLPLVNITGVDVGGDVLVDLLTGKDASGSDVGLPGGVYMGAFGQFNQNILPLVDGFFQLGCLVKVVDVQKALNDKLTSGSVDLSGFDRSGLYYRFGVSVGL